MIVRLLMLLILLGLGLWFLWWFKRTPPKQVARVLRKAGIAALIAVLVLGVLTERLSPILAALAALIPAGMRLFHLIQTFPALQRLLRSLGVGLPGWAGTFGGGAAAGGGARASAIRTRFLAMRLDHASGVMDGDVLEGPFAGRRLADLGLDE